MNTASIPTRVAITEADALPMPPGRLSKQVLNTAGLEAAPLKSVDQNLPIFRLTGSSVLIAVVEPVHARVHL
jgi:hypothetical protein